MVNLEMQSEDGRIDVFLQRLTFLFRQIARNFMRKNVLDDCDISIVDLYKNHMPIEEIYCGTEVDLYISTNNINIDIVKEIKENAKQFYIKFCEVLRTKVNFNNEVLMWFHKFTPENVISGNTSSIVPLLVKMFPNEIANFDSINNQFRALADVERLKSLKMKTYVVFGR
ncbi:hypothetical protein FF38_10163 [Lucilia cuprina]|uniref:Uncharacterized protein n=1 Tax=Lucilia cuprina TaxID=7375 RepID=A0A0L0C9S6_LUCCU|nr:hypothetical protein FF38_10163 [Lucilia cuprina]